MDDEPPVEDNIANLHPITSESLFASRNYGVSTLELADLGLATNGSFDQRARSPFSVSQLNRLALHQRNKN